MEHGYNRQIYAMALHPQYSTVKTTPLHAQNVMPFFCFFIKALLQLLCARVHRVHLLSYAYKKLNERVEVNANIQMTATLKK